MTDTMTLRQILDEAALGEIPTDTELKAVVTGRSSDEAQYNRRRIRMECQKIAQLAQEGLTVRTDDLVEATMAVYGEYSRHKSDRAAAVDPAKEAAKISRSSMGMSDQQRHAEGRIRTSINSTLKGVLHRAANGEDIPESEIKALVIREEVTDAQLAAFRSKLNGAIKQVRETRGDLDKRDGRHTRAQNAEDLADRYVAELQHSGVLDDQDRQDDAEGTMDPAELAALVGRSGAGRQGGR